MPMPEAAVDEYDFPSSREDKIGTAGQISPMQPVPVPHAMHQAAHDHFGLCILVPNAAHALASLCSGQGINHVNPLAAA